MEMSFVLLVQLAIVLDQRCKTLVGVHGAEFEIGSIVLEKVAKVVGDAQSVGASKAHRDVVSRFAQDGASDLALQLDAVSYWVEARMEEDLSAGESRQNANGGHVNVLRGEEEDVDADARVDALLGSSTIEPVLRNEEVLFLVGAVEFGVLTMLERTRPDGGDGGQEDVDLAADGGECGLRASHRRTESSITDHVLAKHAGQIVEQTLDQMARLPDIGQQTSLMGTKGSSMSPTTNICAWSSSGARL